MGTGALDEFGLPLEWRRDPPETSWLENIDDDWGMFTAWCDEHGYRAFPARRTTVLRFLLEPPVSGLRVQRVFDAIALYHEAFYWHTDANAAAFMTMFGLRFAPDGSPIIPPEMLDVEDLF